jgi:two-component system chemotaxis response regulator CheB
MSPPRPIRVLIVDDSALVRRMASAALSSDPQIEVVGTAIDPVAAQEMIPALRPDVLTLDLEMPRMDGLTFLRLLMERHPLPVVVMSSLTSRGSDYALEALRLGAVEVIGKSGAGSIEELGAELVLKVKAAAAARLSRGAGTAPSALRPARKPARPATSFDPRALILLGASTGGTEALRDVLTRLPADLPPIAIVQHIPAVFSRNFADRLNTLCALEVREAADGDRLLPGTALVAPGGHHLLLHWRGDHYAARITEGPLVWHQRPAVDLLFASAAAAGAGARCVAGLLTGMGRDGAEGLLQLRQRGATTFAQDEATCVVFGMPRAAWQAGATDTMLPLGGIAPFLLQSRVPAQADALTPAST